MNLKSVTLQAAIVGAIAGVTSVGATVAVSYLQFRSARADTYRLAIVDKRIEVAQLATSITWRWSGMRKDKPKLLQLAHDFHELMIDRWLYLSTDARSESLKIYVKMLSVRNAIEKSDETAFDASNNQLLQMIPKYHEALLKAVWLEPAPREEPPLGVYGI